ncbi:hypothetical protein L1887_01129 [Cichorium endivia]|nr:hypothetical protein L1887_01129 [Cichorium endivia]
MRHSQISDFTSLTNQFLIYETFGGVGGFHKFLAGCLRFANDIPPRLFSPFRPHPPPPLCFVSKTPLSKTVSPFPISTKSFSHTFLIWVSLNFFLGSGFLGC